MFALQVQLMGTNPDRKVYGVNMGPIWGWQDPGGLHVGPMNFAIREFIYFIWFYSEMIESPINDIKHLHHCTFV